MLFRHAHLVLSNITIHPQAKLPANKAAVAKANKEVTANIQRMEALRPMINKRFEQYQHMQQRIQKEREEWQAKHGTASEAKLSALPSLHLDDHKRTLDPRDHRDLAARLAQKEASRRAAGRIPGQYPQTDVPSSISGWETDQPGGRSYQDDDIKNDLSRRLQEVRASVERPQREYESQPFQPYRGSRQRWPSQAPEDSRSLSYSYPTVPSKHELSQPWKDSGYASKQTLPSHSPPPIRPPKELITQDYQVPPHHATPPNIPSKTPLDAPLLPPKAPPTPELEDFLFSHTTTESGNILRTLFISDNLRHSFLEIARPNTRRNLETCGILAGHMKHNALFISHLIIPSQNSTTDTCEMEDESALFDYVDEQNLMVFGWIHTHPTQSCFMSSRDLHTQSGYQVMLPESIAIVCAPSQHTMRGEPGHDDSTGDYGCFRLTDPPGLKSILNCTKEGVFHPHEVSNLYTGALRPGHVLEVSGLATQIVDLRGKK